MKIQSIAIEFKESKNLFVSAAALLLFALSKGKNMTEGDVENVIQAVKQVIDRSLFFFLCDFLYD